MTFNGYYGFCYGIFNRIDMIVFVLIEENEWGVDCLGVFANYNDAKKEKYDIIREAYNIPVDEIAEEDLDNEISDFEVSYTIMEREVIL